MGASVIASETKWGEAISSVGLFLIYLFCMNEKTVEIVYKNWRGEVGVRQIIPEKIWFGTTEWYPEEQWLLDAFDCGKQESRTFAMSDIREWRPVSSQE